MRSALNERLDASIELKLADDEYPSDVTVQMASSEQFEKAGLNWHYYLSKITLDIKTDAQGRSRIDLRSQEVLKEPVLDLLLEVGWPKGKVFREFTVLVDPPLAYSQPAVPPKSAPALERLSGQPDAPGTSLGASSASILYVRPNQTLWGVAAQVRPQDASVEQTLLAIFEHNPGAFYKPNVNALQAGVAIQIPTREMILRRSKQQALAEFKQQNERWKGRVAPAVTAQAGTAKQETLVLSAPEQEAKVLSTTSTSQKPVPAQDMDLQQRIQRLEQQLVTMQQLLELKNEQLAGLQVAQSADPAQKQTPSVEPDTTISEIPETTAEETTTQEPTTKPEQDAAPTTTIETESPVQESAQPTQTEAVPEKPKPKPKPKRVSAQQPSEQPVTAQEATDWLTPLLGGAAVLLLGGLGFLWWRKRKLDADKDISLDSLYATTSQIRLPDSQAEDKALATEPGGEYQVGTVDESSFLSDFTTSDLTSFETGQHEINPISEADVYLAYGRYQQAEELMQQAIADAPEQDAYKLKLLEIFYAHEDHSGFIAYAEELAAAGKNEDAAFWQKVVEMGEEVAPGSALFGGAKPEQVKISGSAQSSAPVETSDDAGHEPEVDSAASDGGNDDIEDRVEFDFESQAEDGSDSDSNDMDFTLEKVTQPAEAVKPAPSSLEDAADVTDEQHSVDFNLDDFAVPEQPQQQPTEPEPSESEQDLESWDFTDIDFDTESAAEPAVTDATSEATETPTDAASEDLTDLDFNLDSFGTATDTPEETEDFVELDLSEFGSLEDDDLSKSLKDDALAFDFSFDDDDTGVSDLTDNDELETKLDLARAYIDMGDAEAAKTIAQEILAKGKPEQQQQAQAILDRLD
ncbi:MAG: FimV/HubP family polar landmark protein [Methylococcales bacterium]|nr:FimV/HubP family polar landmark protein [Methylococcales bacterium]